MSNLYHAHNGICVLNVTFTFCYNQGSFFVFNLFEVRSTDTTYFTLLLPTVFIPGCNNESWLDIDFLFFLVVTIFAF